MAETYDVVVIGAGPNGLSAAIVAASRGLSTLVIEAAQTAGGGTRSADLTLPGFVHDVCSAVHPMGRASPFFRSLPLAEHGLHWISPPAACAHPLDDGEAALVMNSVDETARLLGPDERAYQSLIGTIARDWEKLESDALSPIGIPRHPLLFAKFGLKALMPASTLARRRFSTEKARALFAGLAAHAILPLESLGSSAIGLVLAAVGGVYGWPIPRGGSQAIANALVSYLQSLGGVVRTGQRIESLDELPPCKIVLADTGPPALARIAGARLSSTNRRALEHFRYGPGVFKVDWALSAPIPWASAECLRSATVHVGGTLDEISESERLPWQGRCAERPFVLVTQPSLFDDSRAPAGKHTAWGYCHVPSGSPVDMTARIEAQIERFAPGFRDMVLARASRGPWMLEQENANLVGGDIAGGANDLAQLFLRPTRRMYRTGAKSIYLCSASTPPGGGVHGMCGYHAATRAIQDEFGDTT
ncbi:MAG: NAD(P)/FAD-dependent oxidoreductase [Gemmatimonadota bacterium]|nr:NAD(P)/FAD-dependent oxidoreductase [Gemmatimonadota bacterium]